MSTASTLGYPQSIVAAPRWKNLLGHFAAIVVAILFLSAGLWKISDPFRWQTMVEQLMVPVAFSMPLAITLGITETLAGVLVLVPRYRKWGALLATGLLLAFMAYIGWNYNALIGRDCSCFPWLKRTVGPGFFYGDGAMLVAALAALGLAPKFSGLRTPAMILAGIALLSGAGYAYNVASQSGIEMPPTITVDGQPYNLRQGRVFLFFYDPSCQHCDLAARHMATYKWQKDVTVIGLPTVNPQWAGSFLHDTKLTARTSLDTEQLRKLVKFQDPPYGVVLNNGRVKATISHYDEPEPETSLKQAGLLD